ncbi:MAG: uncharacterized membrane protein YbhN (UPF0104 family), partial [Kiritimatiellia bacterium]
VGVDWWWLAAAVGLALNASLVVGFKLWAVVRIVDEKRTYRETWSAVMAGAALNAVLPGRGGDLVRAVFLVKDEKDVPLLLGAVVYERLVDLFTLGALVLLMGYGLDWITLFAVFVVCSSVGGGLLLAFLGDKVPFRPDLGERLGRTARLAIRRPHWVLLAGVLSLAAWANNVALMVCAMRAVGVNIPAWEAARATAAAILAGVIPVSISGIGTRDAALVLLLDSWGQGDHLVAAGIIYTALVYWFLAILGSMTLGAKTLQGVREAVAERKAAAAAEKGAVQNPEHDPSDPTDPSDP